MEKELDHNRVNKGLQCPYCGGDTELIDSSIMYGGRSYGWMYRCEGCFAYVGCHKGTTEALGRLAGTTLRELKMETHKHFDAIWERVWKESNYNKLEARTGCYMWLARYMRIPMEDAHIGMMDEEQCREAIHLCIKFDPFKRISETDLY